MSLSLGTKLGVYEILALIGKGGMGEVYRARDTKLDREVAIKVLPEDLAVSSLLSSPTTTTSAFTARQATSLLPTCSPAVSRSSGLSATASSRLLASSNANAALSLPRQHRDCHLPSHVSRVLSNTLSCQSKSHGPAEPKQRDRKISGTRDYGKLKLNPMRAPATW